MLTASEFPPQYEPLQQLGKGGGGEVWSARDRLTGRVVALKLLREHADEGEILALVREATALSGLEGLGVPRVLHFGRLPHSDRAYLVRELVVGQSLADLVAAGATELGRGTVGQHLAAIAQAADLVTRLHRALLLHGDIKPANIIVGADGRATLVDLGLAAHWQEGGAKPEGLTPRYAAPELFCGEPLTPRAEVFALGASVDEVLRLEGAALAEEERAAVGEVVARATAEQPADRFPSADEFAEALRRAAKLEQPPTLELAQAWTIVGIDAVAAQLLERIRAVPSGGGLVLLGAPGSGRSTLLRRVAWALGVGGAAVTFIESPASAEPERALSPAPSAPEVTRLAGTADIVARGTEPPPNTVTGPGNRLDEALRRVLVGRSAAELVLIVDDADQRSRRELDRLDELRRQGSTLVLAASIERTSSCFPDCALERFELPPLAEPTASELVRRMIPSLSNALVSYIVARTGGLPGAIRAVVSRLEGTAVVSVEDVERRLDDVPVPRGAAADPSHLHRLLDLGRFDDAAKLLEGYCDDGTLPVALARAKLSIGRGKPQLALGELRAAQGDLEQESSGDLVATWHVLMARALLRSGDYEQAETQANLALSQLGMDLSEGFDPSQVTDGARPLELGGTLGSMVSDALAVCGLSQSYAARHEDAARTLRHSVEVARLAGDARTLSVALASLAFARQRDEKLDEAHQAYEEALSLAEQAGDAGSVANTRLNLAVIARLRGDLAGSIAHLEAAVDMGRRSGRESTVRHALLNLANLDLFLGRHARARASIDALGAERERLGQSEQAHLLALEAECAVLDGDLAAAEAACRRCAEAYDRMGRSVDAAEARLELVLVLARTAHSESEAPALEAELRHAEQQLAQSGAHRARLATARGHVLRLAGQLDRALVSYGEAIDEGRASGQREWVWRALEARSEVLEATGDLAAADADHRAALTELEQGASELPRDLREVYWSDPRRRRLRERAPVQSVRSEAAPTMALSSAQTQIGGLVREDRLARVLEVNREIAGEYDLDKLLEKVTDHAIALLYAERGFVLLRSRSGDDRLSIHAARDRDGADPHARFSRSIAERVVERGEPFVALDAGQDDRVSDYVSVHQLMLKSVACVPIRSRPGRTIGALYLETRLRPAGMFHEELDTLTALADQVAIAIETARLVSENRQRAAELEQANRELEAAQAKLQATLGRRTEQLVSTRSELRSARAVIQGHFGYQGIVGSSAAMRRVYAIIDRIKDTDVPVLLTGESGTGKEVIARAIHKAGPRAKQRMVGVNCGAIPEHLLESELFGHVKGAFTGADRDSKGLFRELTEGTILLDEIGEMPQKMQAGLLRVLQEKVVRPVGGAREERVNTRVLTATHRNLAEMVSDGRFREDLYYRLNVIELRVPPLRERLEDVPLLIDHYLRLFAARYEREKRTISREAVKRLMGYHWPGNVRQLENVLLNGWILCDRAEIDAHDLELPAERVAASAPVVEATPKPSTLDQRREQERARIVEALESCNWNRARAAQIIGMPRRTFYRRLTEFGIQ